MNDVMETLYQVMMTLSLISILAWAVIGFVFKIAPRASAFMMLANALLSAGLWLTVQRTLEASYLYWPVADVLILMAFLAVGIHIKFLFKQKPDFPQAALFALMIAITFMVIGPDPVHLKGMGLAFSGYSSLLMCALVYVLYSTKDLFDRMVIRLLIGAPFVVLAVFQSFRFLQALVIAPATELSLLSETALWFYVFIVLLINMNCFGMTISWLLSQIKTLAERDSLTGLFNRRMLDERLEHEKVRRERSQTHYAILMIDIDNFKKVNDKYGHKSGDMALKHVSDQLMLAHRKMDFLARFGGEEFVALLVDADLDTAETVAQRMQNYLREKPYICNNGTELYITVSIGIATSEHGGHADILQLADQALYHSKNTGRDKITTYPSITASELQGA